MPLRDPDWHRHRPARVTQKRCYTTKHDALHAFLAVNEHKLERWPLDKEGSRGEFDSLNEKYELEGKRRVDTLAKAIWAAMPAGRPFCLDRLDVDALNETAPGREAGGFDLPDEALEAKLLTKEADYYSQYAGTARRPRKPVNVGGLVASFALGFTAAVVAALAASRSPRP